MCKKLIIWLFIITMTISLIGCGASKSDSAVHEQGSSMALADQKVSVKYSKSLDRDAEKAENYEINTTVASTASSGEAEIAAKNDQSITSNANISQKIIFTGLVNLETLNFDKTKTELCDYITSIGGFTQNSSIHGSGIMYKGLKSAEYVFRVPKAKYNQAFIDMSKFGTVVLEQSSGEDVTDQYFDTESRLKSLKIQQERLQALLQKADKMEDIIKIEKELQTTLYEIENYTGTLKKWDSLVEYSTLNVNITEVQEIKPVKPEEKDGLLSRIAFGFKSSAKGLWEFLQDSIVFVAAALPVIIPLGLISYLVYRLVKRKIKKTKVDEK